MKLFLFVCLSLVVLTGCQKQVMNAYSENVAVFARHLAANDFQLIETATIQAFTDASTGHRFYRAVIAPEAALRQFVLLHFDSAGAFQGGRFVSVSGKLAVNPRGRRHYQGTLQVSDLSHTLLLRSAIQNGYLTDLHSRNITANDTRGTYICEDCSLPEVVVSSQYTSGGVNWATWLRLSALYDYSSTAQYMLIDYGTTDNNGGGTYAPPPFVTADIEEPERKERIDLARYLECFGTIADGPTTTYSITISADLPTDGHPEIFYNWTDMTPGHAFIELNKSTPYGGVRQNIGFYPNVSYKVLTGDYIRSKMIDDGSHEYQARYTVSITEAQFKAAVAKALEASSHEYQISFYNCTDFALEVFNAAGNNLVIPRRAIPNYETDGGSNTPQGLYDRILQLKNSGVTGAVATNNKEYVGVSKGPCN